MGNQVLRGPDSIFFNSQSLFIEYHDIIKSPKLVALIFLKTYEPIKAVFNLSFLEKMEVEEIMKWYLERKDNNYFYSFPRIEPAISDNELEELSNELFTMVETFYTYHSELKFFDVLKHLPRDNKMLHNIYIYSDEYCEYIDNDIKGNLGTRFIYKHGDLNTILKDIPNDSTYVFSDINKINNLVEMNKLNLSSILIPENYNYNKKEDGTFKVDVESLLTEKCIFKFNTFDVIPR